MTPMKVPRRGSLFTKVALSFVAVVAVPLLLLGASSLWFSAREQRVALDRLQQAQSDAAAQRIGGIVVRVQDQLGRVTHLPWGPDAGVDAHRLDALRALRQAPAITDLALLDDRGRERVFVSRLALDRVDALTERGAERAFVEALQRHVHYGPVTFRRETEPVMTLAVAGPRRETGVVIAEVNLTFVWDILRSIRIGREGRAWVADGRGRLVAHPDMNYVLGNPDVSQQVRAIVEQLDAAAARGEPTTIEGLRGERVRAAYAVAQPMDWRVVVELPESEAEEPLRKSVERALWVAFGSFALAVVGALLLARRLLHPIRALTDGAVRLGEGDFGHRIDVRTRDELELLGRRFNTMADVIQSSHVELERKVVERTQALAAANSAKTMFLAAASHDLRQPLHALNLLVAQLRTETDEAQRARIGERIESALADINGLFDGLLDISRIDAGTVRCEARDLPIAPILHRVREAHAADAGAKGLRLRVAPCRAWTHSDPQLLERVLLNLVGNAVRYTERGGVLIGARPRGDELCIEVRDSGIGIAAEHQARVFDAFVQLEGRSRLGGNGLGLGLAIVHRLVGLLGHRLTLRSAPGRGTCCALWLPRAAEGATEAPAPSSLPALPTAAFAGRRVLVLDDDERVQQSTAGLLCSWGCEVVVAKSATQAIDRLGGNAPALVIADLHLDGGELGSDAVTRLRERFDQPIAALLVSGDIGSDARERARAAGLYLLDKPVRPMALRALAARLMAEVDWAAAASSPSS